MSLTDATASQGTATDSLIDAVVFAVAEATDRGPTDIEPLYNVVNPDALSQLFDSLADGRPRSDGRIVFTMEDCEVAVHASGKVVATPPNGASSDAVVKTVGTRPVPE